MINKKINLLFAVFITIISINCSAQKAENRTKVLISTTYGNIKLVLYNETPKHKENFIKLIKEGFYDSTLFHRVIAGFMIQGGDPDSKNAKAGQMLGNGDVGYTIPAEFNLNLYHKRGALAAARMGDNVNPTKASSGCQFYIVQGKKYNEQDIATFEQSKTIRLKKDFSYTTEQKEVYQTEGGTPMLDMEYTVFGEVIEGMDVVDKIADVAKDRRDRPKQDIKMVIKMVKN